jgi:hypothetical protein
MTLIKQSLIIIAFAFSLWSQENNDSLKLGSLPGDTDTVAVTPLRIYNPWKAGGASFIIPGAGQVYTHHYIKAGFFVALDAVFGSMAYFWSQDAANQESTARLYRNWAASDRSKGHPEDSAGDMELSFLSHNNALQSRYSGYDFLTWAVGAHLYNILDAVDNSNRFKDQKSKKPGTAALLAAVPGLGLGQIYNGAYSKAGLMIMGQISLGMMAYNNNRLMVEAQNNYIRLETKIVGNPAADSTRQVTANQYAAQWSGARYQAFTNRNMFLWYTIFFYGYSVFDAVVDAYLHDYPDKMRIKPDLAIGKQGFKVSLSARF